MSTDFESLWIQNRLIMESALEASETVKNIVIISNACVLSRVWLLVTPWTVALPGISVHVISRARVLEQVAISSSRGSSQPRDWTQVVSSNLGYILITYCSVGD